MKKLLTVLLPALTLTALTACDAEYTGADERMFETDYDAGDEDDDLDVVPNDLEGDEMSEQDMDLAAPEGPTPELDVLDAPNGCDPNGPQYDDGENAQAGDESDDGLAAGEDYDEGVMAEDGTDLIVDDPAVYCEGAGGHSYEAGDVWEEDCNLCACTDEGTQCTQMACGVADQLDAPNACGDYDLGEVWPHDDGCNMCTCTEEGIACTLMECEEEVN